MRLSTEKEYVFVSKKGEVFIQSSQTVYTPHKTLERKVWISVQNFLESKRDKRKISVSEFNSLKLTFVCEL